MSDTKTHTPKSSQATKQLQYLAISSQVEASRGIRVAQLAALMVTVPHSLTKLWKNSFKKTAPLRAATKQRLQATVGPQNISGHSVCSTMWGLKDIHATIVMMIFGEERQLIAKHVGL